MPTLSPTPETALSPMPELRTLETLRARVQASLQTCEQAWRTQFAKPAKLGPERIKRWDAARAAHQTQVSGVDDRLLALAYDVSHQDLAAFDEFIETYFSRPLASVQTVLENWQNEPDPRRLSNEGLLTELSVGRGYFPYETLAIALQRLDTLRPLLLAQAKESLHYPPATPHPTAHAVSLALLGQAQDPGLHALLLAHDQAGAPHEPAAHRLLEDEAATLFASACANDTSLCLTTLRLDSLSEQQRGIACEALVILVLAGKLGRAEAIEALEKLAGTLKPSDHWLWNMVVSSACDLWPGELWGRVETAITQGYIEENWTTLADAEADRALGLEGCLKKAGEDERLRLFDDAIAGLEMEPAFFKEEAEDEDEERGAQGTVVRDGVKQGRNELCACGSGKKYKKCCGA